MGLQWVVCVTKLSHFCPRFEFFHKTFETAPCQVPLSDQLVCDLKQEAVLKATAV